MKLPNEEKEIAVLPEDPVQEIEIPLSELAAIDFSPQSIEDMATKVFSGKTRTAIGKRKDVVALLEKKIVGRIGQKGKLLSDKLFELINGVYLVDKMNTVHGKKEVRYYKTPPSLPAIIYAIDRVLGKPKQLQVQASFSLSQLLIGNKNGNTTRTIRPGDNRSVQGQSDLLY